MIADNLAFANGAVTAGDTFAGTRYGTAKRSFWIEEKWADTGWAAEPVTSTSTAKVRNVRVRLGSPGTTTTVTARVYADCFEQPADADPEPIPAGFRCTRGDVLRDGRHPRHDRSAAVADDGARHHVDRDPLDRAHLRRAGERGPQPRAGGRQRRRRAPAPRRWSGCAARWSTQRMTFEQAQRLRRVERVLRARGQHRRPAAGGHGRLPPGPLHRVDGVGRGHVLHVRVDVGRRRPRVRTRCPCGRSGARRRPRSTAKTTTL